MHALRIEVQASLGVAGERIVGKAVPQSGYHIVELPSADIALVMLHVFLKPEIQRRVRIRGRDNVPAGPPSAEVVERGEAAGDMVGLLKCGRGSSDEANAFCCPSKS